MAAIKCSPAWSAATCFGEIALFSESRRTADVVAAEDSEVLVVTQEFIERSMKALPDVVSKLLLNLTQILCDRLGASTRQLIDKVGGDGKPMAEAENTTDAAAAEGDS